MSDFHEPWLPPLDCHAHIAPDVTPGQIDGLGQVVVFAMTRSLAEAMAVQHRPDGSIVWACGVHPRDNTAVASFDARRMASLLSRFVVVGEIGLDRWATNWTQQQQVFEEIMQVVARSPVLCSVHSYGCSKVMIETLHAYRPRGVILHWFTGAPAEIVAAVEMGCAFSVNAAMADEQILGIPRERVLPETDFPVGRKKTGARPGDTLELEQRLGQLWNASREEVRIQCYRNLRDLAVRAEVLDRLPDALIDQLLAV